MLNKSKWTIFAEEKLAPVFHLLFILVLLFVRPESICEAEEPAKRTKLQIGMDAPSFEATTIDGRKISIEEFKGKVTAVVFWATWCKPCKPLLSCLSKYYKKYHLDGFDVVAFSIDEKQSSLVSFLEKAKYPWRNNVCLGDVEHPITKAYGVYALPTIYLLSKDGKIRIDHLPPDDKRFTGPKADEIINALLSSGVMKKGTHTKGAVEGVVIRNGKLVEISASLRSVDGKGKRPSFDNKTRATGAFAFHDVTPGRYLLQLKNGGMSSKTGQLILSKEIDILEDVQWHNFQLKDGTSAIKCPRADSYVMWLRKSSPNEGAMIEYVQYYVKGRLPNGKYEKRDEYSFVGLYPGQYEYRVQWLRGSKVCVQGGQIDVDANETINLEVQPPYGQCKIYGKVQGIQKDLSDPVVFIRKAAAKPIVYSRYYEMGTWDTIALVRNRDMADTGKFKCVDLPAGKYVVTVAQLRSRQYGAPIVQKSKSIHLSDETPEISLVFDLTLDSSK